MIPILNFHNPNHHHNLNPSFDERLVCSVFNNKRVDNDFLTLKHFSYTAGAVCIPTVHGYCRRCFAQSVTVKRGRTNVIKAFSDFTVHHNTYGQRASLVSAETGPYFAENQFIENREFKVGLEAGFSLLC